jgi:hypothetical protein
MVILVHEFLTSRLLAKAFFTRLLYTFAYSIALMPVEIRGQRFFKSREVAQLAGVHRLTLLRWIREGRLADVSRDRNGWRVFSEAEAAAVVDFAKSVDVKTSPNQKLLFTGELRLAENRAATTRGNA